jgi:uncharacterized protein (DUF983 family)
MGGSADPAREPGLMSVAALGLCPRCGARGLFAGLASFAPRCARCGLDFAGFNVGDGPAAFLTLVIGALVCVVAGWMALSLDPPWWVYVVTLGPVTLALIVWGLRAGKGALLAAEYRRRAGEHVADPGGEP